MTVTHLSAADASRRARPWAAALAAVAGSAVLLPLVLSLRLGLANGAGALGGVVAFLGYFTVLTNAFVAAVAAAHATASPAAGRATGLRATSVRGCAVTAILLVGIAYHLLLRELWSPAGAQWLADVLLHYVVPAAALAWWVAVPPEEVPSPRATFAWCLYPLAYLAYALLRGEWLGTYPYPFVDVSRLGYPQVFANAAGLSGVFLVLAFGVRAIASLRRR